MTAARRRIVVTTEGARHCRDVLASLEPDGTELVERFTDSSDLEKRQHAVINEVKNNGWSGPHGWNL